MTRDPIAQTRHLLAQIPTLAAQLPSTRYMARLRDPEGARRPVPGSRPPLDLTLLDLAAGADIQWWVDEAMGQMVAADQEPDDAPTHGDLPSQCQWLATHTEWIAEHNDTFCSEIRALHWTYRRASGHLPQARLSCLTCGNRAFIDGIWFICTEVEEHARTLEDIEHEERFRPKETTDQVCQRFNIEAKHLYDWRRYGKNGRKIKPAKKEGRTLYWWPWDVFCLLNPKVADAIEARDEHTTKEPA